MTEEIKPKKKANEEELSDLHSLVAKIIKKKLKEKDVSDKALDQAIKFLKDNNIIADPEFNAPLRDLKDNFEQKVINPKTLPFPKNA